MRVEGELLDNYRSMDSEELIALLNRQETLTEAARHTLGLVLAERNIKSAGVLELLEGVQRPTANHSPRDWVAIPAERARNHKLYGVGGWLMLFIATHFAGLSLVIQELSDGLEAIDISLWEAVAQVPSLFWYIAYRAFTLITILWMAASKSPHFRPTSALLIVLDLPAASLLILLAYPTDPPRLFPLEIAIPWLMYSLVWISYLERSRRVRVTFEHKVRSAELASLGSKELDNPYKHELQPHGENNTKQLGGGAPTITQEQLTHRQMETSPSAEPKPAADVPLDEDSIYLQISEELENQTLERALWTRCKGEADGNPQLAEALYIKARFKQLTSGAQS